MVCRAQPAHHWAEVLCSLQGSPFPTDTVQDQAAAVQCCGRGGGGTWDHHPQHPLGTLSASHLCAGLLAFIRLLVMGTKLSQKGALRA